MGLRIRVGRGMAAAAGSAEPHAEPQAAMLCALPDAELWTKLQERGWRREIMPKGHRGRQAYYMPPGIFRGPGSKLRQHYFDSLPGVRKYLAAQPIDAPPGRNSEDLAGVSEQPPSRARPPVAAVEVAPPSPHQPVIPSPSRVPAEGASEHALPPSAPGSAVGDGCASLMTALRRLACLLRSTRHEAKCSSSWLSFTQDGPAA